MELGERIKKAEVYINKKAKRCPQLAVILGSGLSDLASIMENKFEIDYEDVPGFVKSTVPGHAGKLVFGRVDNKEIVMMQGRFHLYEGYDLSEVTFPVRVLNRLGVGKLIVTNASGAVNKKFKAGDIVLIKDHINLIGRNPLTGPNMDLYGTRFPDMSECYNRAFINVAKKAAKNVNVAVKEGIYAWSIGPSYETPAEIEMIRRMGGDLVGMSTVPEVIVAKHQKMEVLGVSCATNMAAGILKTPLSHEEVIDTMNRVKNNMINLIKEIIINI